MNLIKQHPQSWLLPLVSSKSWCCLWPLLRCLFILSINPHHLSCVFPFFWLNSVEAGLLSINPSLPWCTEKEEKCTENGHQGPSLLIFVKLASDIGSDNIYHLLPSSEPPIKSWIPWEQTLIWPWSSLFLFNFTTLGSIQDTIAMGSRTLGFVAVSCWKQKWMIDGEIRLFGGRMRV